MFLTFREIIDICIMTLAIGYIFSTIIKREPDLDYDPLKYYSQNKLIEDIKFGVIIAAPAVVLHELAHKVFAMSFGAVATLHAPIGWYAIIIIMRALNFPLFFFVGGYVSHSPLLPLQSFIVSIAGPLTNLLLYGICIGLVKYKLINRKHYKTAMISAKLNMFLFVFNILPIPGFDGFHAIRALWMLLGF
jgi:Zn-dependent protease